MVKIDLKDFSTRGYGSRNVESLGFTTNPLELVSGVSVSSLIEDSEDNTFQIVGQKNTIDNVLTLYISVTDGYGELVSDEDAAGLSFKLLITPRGIDETFFKVSFDMEHSSEMHTLKGFPEGEYQLVALDPNGYEWEDFNISVWISVSE